MYQGDVEMKLIRPCIVGLLAIAVTIGFFIKTVPADVFIPFATGLIIYWFKSRDEEKQR